MKKDLTVKIQKFFFYSLLLSLTALSACKKKGSVIKSQENPIHAPNKQQKEVFQKESEQNQAEQTDPQTENKVAQTEDDTPLIPEPHVPKAQVIKEPTRVNINAQNFLEHCSPREDFRYRERFADQLPYHFARIDVFTAGSKLHRNHHQNGILQEILVLSIDGFIRLIGRVSSGNKSRGNGTPIQRWGLFGFWEKKFQLVESRSGTPTHGKPMPSSIMLMNHNPELEDCRYNKYCFHGTSGYGFAEYGYPRSKGCIRCATVQNPNLEHWNLDGLHRELWNHINPLKRNNIALNSDSPVVQWALRNEGWTPTSEKDHQLLVEMNKKIKIYTHDSHSLRSEAPEWIRFFEALYPEDLIRHSIGNRKNQIRTHYRSYRPSPETRLEPQILCDLYRYENNREI